MTTSAVGPGTAGDKGDEGLPRALSWGLSATASQGERIGVRELAALYGCVGDIVTTVSIHDVLLRTLPSIVQAPAIDTEAESRGGFLLWGPRWALQEAAAVVRAFLMLEAKLSDLKRGDSGSIDELSVSEEFAHTLQVGVQCSIERTHLRVFVRRYRKVSATLFFANLHQHADVPLFRVARLSDWRSLTSRPALNLSGTRQVNMSLAALRALADPATLRVSNKLASTSDTLPNDAVGPRGDRQENNFDARADWPKRRVLIRATVLEMAETAVS